MSSGRRGSLREGDVAVIRGGPVYSVADHPGTRPGITIARGNVCVDPDGRLLAQPMALGVRTWGNSRDGSDVLLVGTWEAETEAGRPLLAAMPRLIVQRRSTSPLLGVLAEEITREEPGQEVVLDRLLDLVLVTVLRDWLAGEEQVTRGLATTDPVVGEALRLMHHHPERGWTIASLAAEVGVSRAALARRFGEARRGAADDLPHLLAARAGRGPARRLRRRDRGGRPPGRLRQRVRAERGVQAGAGTQSAAAPPGASPTRLDDPGGVEARGEVRDRGTGQGAAPGPLRLRHHPGDPAGCAALLRGRGQARPADGSRCTGTPAPARPPRGPPRAR
nr:cupin domain-containing protein [Nocardioides convexus]